MHAIGRHPDQRCLLVRDRMHQIVVARIAERLHNVLRNQIALRAARHPRGRADTQQIHVANLVVVPRHRLDRQAVRQVHADRAAVLFVDITVAVDNKLRARDDPASADIVGKPGFLKIQDGNIFGQLVIIFRVCDPDQTIFFIEASFKTCCNSSIDLYL